MSTPGGSDVSRSRARDEVISALHSAGLEAERPDPFGFVVSLPGDHKMTTVCALMVGPHAVTANAFIARRPDEDHAEVYRLLLQRNARLRGVAFALDRLGDVYLVASLPTATVTAASVDALLGSIVEAADSAFDRILATGFASSIRREWEWRRSHGDPADNLEPFRVLLALDREDPAR